MVLPFEFILNRAGLDAVVEGVSQVEGESKRNLAADRKITEVRSFVPDLSHILLEPVTLSASLSFLDTSLQDSRYSAPPVEELPTMLNPTLVVDDDDLDDEIDDDEFDEDEDDSMDDDDDAFP